MVTKKNLGEIVKKLLSHVESSDGVTYRDEVVSKVIAICAQEHYQVRRHCWLHFSCMLTIFSIATTLRISDQFITDFEWYVKVLVQLTQVEGIRHGKLLASQVCLLVLGGIEKKWVGALISLSNAVSGINRLPFSPGSLVGSYWTWQYVWRSCGHTLRSRWLHC